MTFDKDVFLVKEVISNEIFRLQGIGDFSQVCETYCNSENINLL